MKVLKIAGCAVLGFWIAAGCGSDDDGSRIDGLGDASAGAAGQFAGSAGTPARGGSTGSGGVPGGAGGVAGAAADGGVVGGSGGGVLPDASAGAGGGLNCTATGQTCAANADCCSLICDGTTNTCASSPTGACRLAGENCAVGTDCCNLSCVGGVCGSQCTSDTGACTADGECCSGNCNAGNCQALNTACRTSGNTCSQDVDCCSRLCQNGVCDIQASFCVQEGDICTAGDQCCTTRCNMAAGATVGICGPPPSTGAVNCGDGYEGRVCSSCGECCSALCAPYGATGLFVCQPAGGCHVNGDFCRTDLDCCGGDPNSGLPGAGNVTCLRENPGDEIGRCRNSISCSPQGEVCHYQDYTCGNSSQSNNCCQATGLSGRCELDSEGVLRCNGFRECADGEGDGERCSLCQLDELGVPRCNGLGACRQPGETCSTSADCCDSLPCIPDSQGVLRCLVPPPTPDGSPPTVCVNLDGSCTVDADCCTGLTCLRPIGSTRGLCTDVFTPPPPPPPPDGAPPPPTDAQPPPECATYGQQCTTTADCCNTDLGVQCVTGGTGTLACLIPG